MKNKKLIHDFTHNKEDIIQRFIRDFLNKLKKRKNFNLMFYNFKII